MPLPSACVGCYIQTCRKSKEKTLNVCEYGIAYIRDGQSIERKEPLVPLRFVCTNLRHELNYIFQSIMNEAINIDPRVSKKNVDLDSSPSKIVGLTIVIDHFVQMITGVNDFHPDILASNYGSGSTRLTSIVTKYFNIYSLLKHSERAKNLVLKSNVNTQLSIDYCNYIIEYIIAVLIDNIWKYSIDNTDVLVNCNQIEDNYAELTFSNWSQPIPDGKDIFTKGVKGHDTIYGFGYGLFWAQILTDHYNRIQLDTNRVLTLTYEQQVESSELCKQVFKLSNIILWKK